MFKILCQPVTGQCERSATITTGTDTNVTGYLFDTRNQLRQVTVGGSTVGQFLYDHSGQRIETTFTYHSQTDQNQAPATSETKHSLYEGIQLLAEYQLNAERSTTCYYMDTHSSDITWTPTLVLSPDC